jgi:hypothetical protein
MALAEGVWQASLDSATFIGNVDSVANGGRTYSAVRPLGVMLSFKTGVRGSLDFTPFLHIRVAPGIGGGFGRLEQALIVLSVASLAYGIAWHASTIVWHRPFGIG